MLSKPHRSRITENQRQHVYIERDWKEYLGESALIIFSVLLALVLTEVINSLHEKEKTNTLLKNIHNEINRNKGFVKEMHAYNLQVVKRIDSALYAGEEQQGLIDSGEFHYKKLMSHGVLYRSLEDVAWQVAMNNNISSKIDFETIALLTNLYNEQQKMIKVEAEVAKILLSYESRDPAKLHQTLLLVRDNYYGWGIDREPELLKSYDEALVRLDQY
ncbi:MAG: hypothetical protein JWN76_1161 [Chitinophagaceae bacterium]|nr:hypothetical protein [Chitinophagaceae bacterium]